MKKQKNGKPSNTIAVNKKAKFNYEMQEDMEAGLVLKGWQVKSLRAGKVSLANNPHIIINAKGEAFISGMEIIPMVQANTHESRDSNQSIKLLLHKKEIARLIGQTEQKGYTIILYNLYWKRDKVKAKIALAKGKSSGDKRQTIKEREGKIEAQRAIKKAF